MITIIDSGISNLGSVLAAMRRISAPAEVTTAPAAVSNARAILLPGVGAFADGMSGLRKHGLIEPIKVAAKAGKPILGICLGMQLLAEASDEFGDHEGLGLIPGQVKKLPPAAGQRVPNIGWCDMDTRRDARLFAGIDNLAPFYFVHSFHLICKQPAHSVGTIAFGPTPITVAVERDNIFGAQFHPEKSQDAGLTFLANFAAYAASR
jgi:imidazole glycerol-phosphate synthase subunit HisH